MTTTHRTTRPLAANALFSALTGAILAIAPSTAGGWLGVEIDGWLRLLGAVLLGHAALLGWVLSRPRQDGWTRLNLAAIAPYPLVMIALVAANVIERRLGVALVLADGAIVGGLAVAQWNAIRDRVESVAPLTA